MEQLARDIHGFVNNIKFLILVWLCHWQPGTNMTLEWPKKKKCWNNICSLGPGDHDGGYLVLQFVVFWKLLPRWYIAENWLDELYCARTIYVVVRSKIFNFSPAPRYTYLVVGTYVSSKNNLWCVSPSGDFQSFFCLFGIFLARLRSINCIISYRFAWKEHFAGGIS